MRTGLHPAMYQVSERKIQKMAAELVVDDQGKIEALSVVMNEYLIAHRFCYKGGALWGIN